MNKRTNISHSQNFLTSSVILKQLTAEISLNRETIIYEIGPGKGHWTHYLSRQFQRVIGIELDEQLLTRLQADFDQQAHVKLIHSDILAYQFPRQASPSYAVVGNIPFNLSTKIVKHIVFDSLATDAYLIVEKGFAQRLTGPRLSVQQALLLTQMDMTYKRTIAANWFHPKPRIDAAFIHLSRKQQPDVPAHQLKLFEQFARDVLSGQARRWFTKNQWRRATQHAKITTQTTLSYHQLLSLFKSYQLFR